MAMLELQRVVKHYRSESEQVRAVDGIDLAVGAGEIAALRGPSGSGKTTLLMLTAGLLTPDAGVVLYRGEDLAGFSERARSEHLMRHVGFIYQGFQLMPRVSAVENAALKLIHSGVGRRAARTRAIPWLERVGLADRLTHTPEQLSSGERQRVAIARVLASEPQLILADEPTGALDSTRSREVVSLMRSIAHERKVAIVLATHDSEAARLADRRLVLRDGRLTESRDADEALADTVGSGSA